MWSAFLQTYNQIGASYLPVFTVVILHFIGICEAPKQDIQKTSVVDHNYDPVAPVSDKISFAMEFSSPVYGGNEWPIAASLLSEAMDGRYLQL